MGRPPSVALTVPALQSLMNPGELLQCCSYCNKRVPSATIIVMATDVSTQREESTSGKCEYGIISCPRCGRPSSVALTVPALHY